MSKRSLSIITICAFAIILFSCATNKTARKNIIGSWQPYKVGTMEIRKLTPSDDTVSHQFSESDLTMLNDLKRSLSKPGTDGTVKKSTSSDYSNLITEASTSYIFSKEGYAGRDNALLPMRGTWKMNKKGTQVTITDAGTLDQFTLDIDSLTPGKMVATNKNLNGVKVSYYKNQ